MPLITVVTGANSGIGRATALHFAEQGHRVFGTVRSVDRAAKLEMMAAERGVVITLVELDVSDDASVRTGFEQILAATDHVDVLVNNAGVGGNAVVEECTSELLMDVLDTNVAGVVRCAAAVLPSMRARRSGVIVNISSIAGRIGALAQAPYTASKWAVEGLSEELAQEVAPFGVRVVIIEPGITKSAIFAKNVDLPDTTGAYRDHYRRMMQMYAAGLADVTDAFDVARLIEHAVTTDAPQLRYVVSWGGDELVSGRRRMTDEEWVDLGRVTTDDEYYVNFEKAFGLDIRPS